MDIRDTQTAKVWSIKENPNRKKAYVTLSIYEGKDVEGKNKYSSWIAEFVGSAYKQVSQLKEKDEIVLTKAKIEKNYVKEKKTAYYNLIVFHFEFSGEKALDEPDIPDEWTDVDTF